VLAVGLAVLWRFGAPPAEPQLVAPERDRASAGRMG
jgi:hypothetical protein